MIVHNDAVWKRECKMPKGVIPFKTWAWQTPGRESEAGANSCPCLWWYGSRWQLALLLWMFTSLCVRGLRCLSLLSINLNPAWNSLNLFFYLGEKLFLPFVSGRFWLCFPALAGMSFSEGLVLTWVLLLGALLSDRSVLFWSKTRAEEEFRRLWDGIWLSLFLSCAARIHILNVTYFSAALLNKFIICICLLFFFFPFFFFFFFSFFFSDGRKKRSVHTPQRHQLLLANRSMLIHRSWCFSKKYWRASNCQ